MRKSLALLVVLALLSGYGIYWANATIGDEVDNVTFTENAIYGDKSTVEGVTIERNAKYNNFMYWNTTYTVGEESAIDTDFCYYPFGKNENYESTYNGIWLDPFNTSIWYDEITLANTKAEDLHGLNRAFYELIEEAPEGQKTQRIIYLKDYTTYYSFGLQITLPNCYLNINWDEGDSDEKKILTAFNDFFKIPVIDEEIYCIAVNKDEDGKVIGCGYSSRFGGMTINDIEIADLQTEKDAFYLAISSAVYTEDTCYFTFSPTTTNGNLVDTSLIPGGYGIYSFRYDSENGAIDADSLQMVYALEPAGDVNLKLDEEMGNLLIFTEDEMQFYMSVVDLETMQQKQKIAYGKMDDVNLAKCYWVEDDFLIAQYSYYEAMIFSKNADGTYTMEYSIPAEVPEVSEQAYFLTGSDCVYDWDGERLLVADSLRITEPYWQKLCGIYLAAFDETGLIYYGEYYSSLDTGIMSNCEPTDNEPISIHWK